MFKLECIESNCEFKTQELPFEHAEKMLDKHLVRSHSLSSSSSQMNVDSSSGSGSRPSASCYALISGLPASLAVEDIKRMLDSQGIIEADVCVLVTEAGVPSGEAVIKLRSEELFQKLSSINFAMIYPNSSIRVTESTSSMFVRHQKTTLSSGSVYIRLKGLVWSATEEDIRKFLHDCKIISTFIIQTPAGRPSGEAVLQLESEEDTRRAKKHNKKYLGSRFVVIEEIAEEQFKLETLNIAAEEEQPPKKIVKVTEYEENIVKLGNIHKDATEGELMLFFNERDCHPERIFITNSSEGGRSQVFVLLQSKEAVIQALACQNSTFKGKRVNVDKVEKNPALFQKLEKEQISCLCHNNRRKVEEELAKVLKDRKTVSLNSAALLDISPNKKERRKINSILVNEGPQRVRWNLDDVQRVFEKSSTWRSLQNFHSLPTYEKRITNEEIKINMKKFTEKHKENPSSNIKDSKKYKQFESKLTSKAEIDVKDWITEALKGNRGLLIRSLDYKKLATLRNIMAMRQLGIVIPVNSCVDEVNHKEDDHIIECYASESDLMIFYQLKNKLCIRIIEVKRQDCAPWEERRPLNERLILKALEQLEKGVNLVLSMIPDIPSENIDIKLFTAFPETDCSSLFCENCQRFNIDTNDEQRSKFEWFLKLGLSENSEDSNNHEFLLKICSRLVGMSSMLHRSNLSPGDCHKLERKEIADTEQRMEESLTEKKLSGDVIFLNEDQVNILVADSKNLNVCFTGGSGTGKTQMAVALMSKIAKETTENKENVHIYIATCIKSKTALLLEKLKEDMKDMEKIECHPLGHLIKTLDPSMKERHKINDSYKMSPLLSEIASKLSEKHRGERERVLLFVDEIMTFGKPDSLDWSKFPTFSNMNIFLAFSPVGFKSGKIMKIISGEPTRQEPGTEYMILPSAFTHCCLTLRYRNSQMLQKATANIGKHIGKYVEADEAPAVDVQGDKIGWIDLGNQFDQIQLENALKKVKEKIIEKQISIKDIIVLIDKDFYEVKRYRSVCESTLRGGGHNWDKLDILDERLFHGCERNTVVYIGAGHLEAFTRAQVNLFVITIAVSKKSEHWYQSYKAALEEEIKESTVYKI